MRLYSFKHKRATVEPWIDAPNPRRLRIALFEKGIEIPTTSVNLLKLEHLNPEISDKNPFKSLPFLELEDGRVIADSYAIIEYFEELQTGLSLLGIDSVRRAQVRTWERRCEEWIMQRSMTMFRHASRHYSGRTRQQRDVFLEARDFAAENLGWISKHLEGRQFLVDEFSVADITLVVGLDYSMALGLEFDQSWAGLAEWHQRMKSRKSYWA
jgi:glutathione S-transferase